MSYIYAGHLGSIYTSTYELDYEDLYCEQCGDSDSLVAEVDTTADLLDAICELYSFYDFSPDYIQEFIQEEYPEFDIAIPMADLPERDWECTGRDQCPIYCNFFEANCDFYYSLSDPDPDCNWCHKNFEYELHRLNKSVELNTVLN